MSNNSNKPSTTTQESGLGSSEFSNLFNFSSQDPQHTFPYFMNTPNNESSNFQNSDENINPLFSNQSIFI